MSNCERCGSKVDNKNRRTEFKCPKCESIKFKRKALKPVVKKVRKNFIKIKKLEIGCLVENLYLYGGYAEQKAFCCDVDFLVTWDRLKLENYVEKKLKLFIDKINKFYYEDEAESKEFMTLKIIGLLEKGEFWDFRSCEEYPECLGCYDDDDECLGNDESFYSELRETGIHNVCLLECNYDKKQSIPDCVLGGECSYHFFKGAVESYFTNKISKMLKDQADVSFKSFNLNVKVLHLKAAYSIQDFQKRNEKLEFRLVKINKKKNLRLF